MVVTHLLSILLVTLAANNRACLGLDEYFSTIVFRQEVGILEWLIFPGAKCFGWAGMLFFTMPGIAIYCISTGSHELFYFQALSTIVGQCICRTMKNVFCRERPYPPENIRRVVKIYKTRHSIFDSDGASYPSGDSMAGASVAATFAIAFQQPLFLLLAFWPILGRMYFWFHFFLDCAGGVLVGAFGAVVTEYASGGYMNLELWHMLVGLVLFVTYSKASKLLLPKRRHAKDGSNKLKGSKKK